MRSFLFVPGDSQRKFENAKKTAADALILDLEDSITPDEKIAARRTVREMLDARRPRRHHAGPARRHRAAEMRGRRRRQSPLAVSRCIRGRRRHRAWHDA